VSTRLVPWIRTAIAGPALGALSFVTVSVFVFGWTDPKFGGRFGNWLMGMAAGGVLALLLAAALLGADVFLLRLGLRRPPEGARAFAGGVAAPVLVFGCYLLVPPGHYEMGPGFFAALIAPVVGVAFALRLLLGRPAAA
jgi:hypothetical protein